MRFATNLDRRKNTPVADAEGAKKHKLIELLKSHGGLSFEQDGSHFEPKVVPLPQGNKGDWEIDPVDLDFSYSVWIAKGEILKAYWRVIPVAVKHMLSSELMNVLLHKVEDFGLCKLIRAQDAHDVTGETEKYCYMAAQVFKHGKDDRYDPYMADGHRSLRKLTPVQSPLDYIQPFWSIPCIFTFFLDTSEGYELYFPSLNRYVFRAANLNNYRIVCRDCKSGLVMLLELHKEGKKPQLMWFDIVRGQFLEAVFRLPFFVEDRLDVIGAFFSIEWFTVVYFSGDDTIIVYKFKQGVMRIHYLEGEQSPVAALQIGGELWWVDMLSLNMCKIQILTTDDDLMAIDCPLLGLWNGASLISSFLYNETAAGFAVMKNGELHLLLCYWTTDGLICTEFYFDDLGMTTCFSSFKTGFCRSLPYNLSDRLFVTCHEGHHCLVIRENDTEGEIWRDCPYRSAGLDECLCECFCFCYTV